MSSRSPLHRTYAKYRRALDKLVETHEEEAIDIEDYAIAMQEKLAKSRIYIQGMMTHIEDLQGCPYQPQPIDPIDLSAQLDKVIGDNFKSL